LFSNTPRNIFLYFHIYTIQLYYTGRPTKFLTAKYVNAKWINKPNHHPKSHKFLTSTFNNKQTSNHIRGWIATKWYVWTYYY